MSAIKTVIFIISLVWNVGSVLATEAHTEQIASFLQQHWPANGVPLQGPKPAGFSAIEASLNPEQCGLCHSRQFNDWQGSRHAHSMGPGVLGQLPSLLQNDPASARECFRCHTPLQEQQNILQNKKGRWHKNRLFDETLQHRGLVCAGCHVRQWQRFGPPRKNTPDTFGKTGKGRLPHNGFTAHAAFQSSEFCKTCHQFDKSGYALNGKPLENTFQEWSQSRYAKDGVQCQNCHMPERRHLWRGIHDKKMVQAGVEINAAIEQKVYVPGDTVKATITVKNTGTGHHFPTYVTPKVFIRAYLLNAQGDFLPDTLQEAVIGRALSEDMGSELYDTRIPAGDSLSVQYRHAVTANGMTLRIEVRVEPDHFYAQFFQRMGAQPGDTLHDALEDTRKSAYSIYDRSIPLGQTPPQYTTTSSEHATPALDTSAAHSNKVDWNEKQLTWHDYDEALELAHKNNQPVLFLLYAGWCPTCHAYKHIFYDDAMVHATENIILARANVDRHPELNQKFNLDGEYVPRTYLLSPDGEIIEAAYAEKAFPRYFLGAETPEGFLSLLRRIP